MKILVVEDDARSRDLLVKYLGAKGHAVRTAEDGRRAPYACPFGRVK